MTHTPTHLKLYVLLTLCLSVSLLAPDSLANPAPSLQGNVNISTTLPETPSRFHQIVVEPAKTLWKSMDVVLTRWVLRPLARPSSQLAWIGRVSKEAAPAIAQDASHWLASAYHPARTTLELSPPLKAHRHSPFPDALEAALIQQGFALSHPDQAIEGAQWLRYELTPWQDGWMLTLELPGQTISRLYGPEGQGQGAFHVKEESTR